MSPKLLASVGLSGVGLACLLIAAPPSLPLPVENDRCVADDQVSLFKCRNAWLMSLSQSSVRRAGADREALSGLAQSLPPLKPEVRAEEAGSDFALAPLLPISGPQTPNLEFFRDYEEAYLRACTRSRTAAECQCLMEATQAILTFDRFARLIQSGWEELGRDPGYVGATQQAGCGLPPITRKAEREGGSPAALPVAQQQRE